MITVKVPATSANMGCGFDCIGIALQFYNTVKAEETDSGLKIEILDETRLFLPKDERSLVYRAMHSVFEEAGYAEKGLHIIQDNKIPVTRGLGSSGASIIAGIMAADKICKANMSKEDITDMASRIEGHPDNVAAAVYGGMTVSVEDGDKIYCHKISVNANRLLFAVFIPDFTLRTSTARNILPDTVPHADAVFNAGRTSLLTAAMMNEDYSMLKTALQDRLHQPYRRGLIKGLDKIFRKSEEFGGYGSYISGAGPVIVTPVDAKFANDFRYKMKSYLRKNLKDWDLAVLKPDNLGARVIKEEEYESDC